MDWAKSAFASGSAILAYDWIYLPLVRLTGIEPWSATTYGLSLWCLGAILGVGILAVRGAHQ